MKKTSEKFSETDNFELLYVYINEFNKCFKENEFIFSNEYYINYNISKKIFTIKKNKNDKYENFFDNKIKSINIVVGKNGAGKTTLLEILGSKKNERRVYINENNDYGWFAIYKCTENIFYIEGENLNIVNNFNGMIEGNVYKPLYSIIFEYDFNSLDIPSCDLFGNHYHTGSLFYYYFRRENYALYSNEKKENDEVTHLLPRSYIKKGDLKNLYVFATEESDLFKNLSSNALNLNITFIRKDDEINSFWRLFYEKIRSEEYELLDKKNRVCFLIMKQAIFDIYNGVLYKNIEYEDKFFNEFELINTNDNTMEKINQALTIICTTCDEIGNTYSFKNNDYLIYRNFILEICNLIKKIPEKYIEEKTCTNKVINEIRPISQKFIIKIDLSIEREKIIEDFLDLFDNGAKELAFLYEFKSMFEVNLNNTLSEGEFEFLKTYSAIYQTMYSTDNVQKSAIILLDEPDQAFHPMWISSFIKNLVELVKSANKEKNIKYQFIITTHSPFMLSDIPRDFVTCIDIDEKERKRIVKKSNKTFASNYYEIIQDSFFLDDSVGQFAKDKINRTIDLISNIETKSLNKSDFNTIQNTIDVIDDQYLKNSLLIMFNNKIVKHKDIKSLYLEKEILERRLKNIENELGDLDDKDR